MVMSPAWQSGLLIGVRRGVAIEQGACRIGKPPDRRYLGIPLPLRLSGRFRGTYGSCGG